MTAANNAVSAMARIVLRVDDCAPTHILQLLLQSVFEQSESQARSLISVGWELGDAILGTYDIARAQTLLAEAQTFAHNEKVSLNMRIEAVPVGPLVERLVNHVPKIPHDHQRLKYHHQCFDQHFKGWSQHEIVTICGRFPSYLRIDVQQALDITLSSADQRLGVMASESSQPVTMATLFTEDTNAKCVVPLQYEQLSTGAGEGVRCLRNVVWYASEEGVPYAVLLSNYVDTQGCDQIYLEVAAPQSDTQYLIAQHILQRIERAIYAQSVYRGKVISLRRKASTEQSSGIRVHQLTPVHADDLILPRPTYQMIETNVVQFAKQKDALRALGQSTKKSVLFYGPSGTGKSYAIRFLVDQLPEYTLLVIEPEHALLLGQYMALAQSLQPALVVVEGVDLIAAGQDRAQSGSDDILLNSFLNELDSLSEEAELLFILTTNRPQVLEAALATRPGRIDQAIEFPMPDSVSRARLVALYGKRLVMSDALIEEIVASTDGLSAAFIKELMRRIAQVSIAQGRAGYVEEKDVSHSLEEMLFTGGQVRAPLVDNPLDASHMH